MKPAESTCYTTFQFKCGCAFLLCLPLVYFRTFTQNDTAILQFFEQTSDYIDAKCWLSDGHWTEFRYLTKLRNGSIIDSKQTPYKYPPFDRNMVTNEAQDYYEGKWTNQCKILTTFGKTEASYLDVSQNGVCRVVRGRENEVPCIR